MDKWMDKGTDGWLVVRFAGQVGGWMTVTLAKGDSVIHHVG